MRDDVGMLNKQFKIFCGTILLVILLVFAGLLWEVKSECTYQLVPDVCHAPFECTVDNICDCTTADFTEDYNAGRIQHERPYRCDPTDKERPPTVYCNVVAFIVTTIGCLWIGWVAVVEYGRKCDCVDECAPECGCPKGEPWNCKCSHSCVNCNNKSVHGVKQVCVCPPCLKHFKEGHTTPNKASIEKGDNVNVVCICQGCYNGCKCTQHGEICSFRKDILVVKAKRV